LIQNHFRKEIEYKSRIFSALQLIWVLKIERFQNSIKKKSDRILLNKIKKINYEVRNVILQKYLEYSINQFKEKIKKFFSQKARKKLQEQEKIDEEDHSSSQIEIPKQYPNPNPLTSSENIIQNLNEEST